MHYKTISDNTKQNNIRPSKKKTRHYKIIQDKIIQYKTRAEIMWQDKTIQHNII